MEPIGTITIHYPHVDDETREILQSVMIEAENFADFTERLCTKVCNEETPILTQYLAFYFTILPGNYRLLERFVVAERVVVMAEPLFLIMKERTGQSVSVENLKIALGKALEFAPNDWYTCHIYLSWRRLHTEMISSFTESDYGTHPYESVISAIEDNQSLEYFELFLHIIKADRLYEENRVADAFNLYEQAVEIAEKFDDRMAMADILFFWAQKTRYSDFGKGVDLLSRANILYEDLGDLSGVNGIRFEMAFIMASRGELNAAIDYLTDYIGSREVLAQPSDLAMCVLAFFYNHIENGDKALEILNEVHIKEATPLPIVCWYHEEKTWALIIQGRLDEARIEFERARREVTKTGSTIFLIEVELTEGLIEKYEHSFDRATASFMSVLESLEQNPAPFYLKTLCLLNLTDIEVEKLRIDKMETDADTSGPWMQKLEDHVRNNDIPGIRAWSKILKAKLRRKQGQDEEANELLDDVFKTAESSSMSFLRDIVKISIPELLLDFE